MKNIPTPVAVVVIIAVVVIVVLLGLWYLNRPSTVPVGGAGTAPQPLVPGEQPGQTGQQGGKPITPTY
ncbi:MAG: hypothetical protein N2116_03325 [Armatimonadetes bacterium]|nr:hypothetical protein [Armatimonadota bacterium]